MGERVIGAQGTDSNVLGYEPDGRPIYRVDGALNSALSPNTSATDVQERLRSMDPRKTDATIWNAIDSLQVNPDRKVEILLAAIQEYHDQVKRLVEDNTERLMRSRPFVGFPPSASDTGS